MEKLDTPPRRVEFHVAGGLTLTADAYGDPAAVPVLFLHGAGQTRHAWSGAARKLAAAGFQALTLDLRGHGESGWAADGDYTLEAFVDDIRGVIQKLPDRPFLVGASLGGMSALLLEGTSPEPVSRGVVLVDVAPRVDMRGVIRALEFMGARPDGFASLEEAADAVAGFLPERGRPKALSGLEKNLRRGPDGRYYWHWDPTLMQRWTSERWSPDNLRLAIAERIEAARRLRVPVLLVRGRTSDVVSEEAAQELLTLVPHAKYVDLAAGHMVAGSSNDAFAGAVVAFLKGA